DVSANPSVVVLENGELQKATQGHFAFNIRAGLSHWSYMPASPINVALSGSQLSVADLQKFAGKNYPVTGTLAIKASVHGSQLNPVGQGNITLTEGVISGEPVQSASVTFRGDGSSVDTSLNAHMPAGSVNGKASIDPKTGGYNFQLRATGLRLENLQAVKARNI